MWNRIEAKGKIVKYALCILVPLSLLPLAISPFQESRCIFVVLLIASYWILEPVDIAVTALLPVVLFPVLGILSSAEVSSSYMSETLMLLMGGSLIAMGIEKTNLHERVSLKVLLLIGTHIRWLMLGFMITTMFLSMWVSNIATTVMMVPIAEAVIAEINLTRENNEPAVQTTGSGNTSSEISNNQEQDPEKNSGRAETTYPIKLALLLGTVYSANIGGTATTTGDFPNLIFVELMERTYPESTEITFTSWMTYNVPGMVVCVLCAWIYLYFIYVRLSGSRRKSDAASEKAVRRVLNRRYEKLGRISFEEAIVIACFILVALLWIFRKPKFINGWQDALGPNVNLGDSVPAIAVAFILFIIPKNPRKLSSGSVLDWKDTQSKMPWGIIVVIGGGSALARGIQKSGLSRLLAQRLVLLKVLGPRAVVAVMCFVTAAITEILMNTTAANILLPLMNDMAISMKMNPIFVMLPVAIACSYAFMLPIAAGANAFVFDRGQFRTIDMAKVGILMNVICCCVQLFMINLIGMRIFNLNEFPNWAMEAYNATLVNETYNAYAT